MGSVAKSLRPPLIRALRAVIDRAVIRKAVLVG